MPTANNSNTRKRVARRQNKLVVGDGQGQFYRRTTTIDVLPDDVLVEIFYSYLYPVDLPVDGWYTLVHVCGRWRRVVFASPRRLNLQLLCTNTTPVKELLGIWPALPIVIKYHDIFRLGRPEDATNIYAALKHNDRTCEITLERISNSLMRRFAEMKKPFTALTFLRLLSYDETTPVIPNSFLGGLAPRLRTLDLVGIPFPRIPRLLLSTHDLVDLVLWSIPHSGYILPEAMVIVLSSLTSLRSLALGFQSPRLPINRRPSALARTSHPALTSFQFKGVSAYLELFISRIDIPLLNSIQITFFHQLIFDIPLFREFIRRTEAFKTLHRAHIDFFDDSAQVRFPLTNPEAYNKYLKLTISCKPLDWQLSSLARVCSSLPPLPTLERLDILGYQRSNWQNDIEDTQWLELLHPFITVKRLYLDKYLPPRVALALQELDGGRITEVLPALQNLFIEAFQSSRPVQEAIGQFVAARQLFGHPIAVRSWWD